MNIFKSLVSVFSKGSRNHQGDRQASQNQKVNKNDRSNGLLFFALLILTINVVSCWGVITDPQSNPDAVKSAFTLNTTIVSSLIGLVIAPILGGHGTHDLSHFRSGNFLDGLTHHFHSVDKECKRSQ